MIDLNDLKRIALENTEKDDNFHRYIVGWENGLFDTEFYLTPSKMFVEDFANKYEVIAWCEIPQFF